MNIHPGRPSESGRNQHVPNSGRVRNTRRPSFNVRQPSLESSWFVQKEPQNHLHSHHSEEGPTVVIDATIFGIYIFERLKDGLNPDIYSDTRPYLPLTAPPHERLRWVCRHSLSHFSWFCPKSKKTKPCPTISAGPDLMYLVFGEQSHRKDLFDGGPVTVYDFCAMLSWIE